MRPLAMCLSILPRFGLHSFATSCLQSSQSSRHPGNRISFRLLSSRTSSVLEGEEKSKKWIRKTIMTNTEEKKGDSASKIKISNTIKYSLPIETTNELNVGKSETRELERLQNCDLQQKIDEDFEELARLITVIAFDLETTGLSRGDDRIIEIGLQDLVGGANSTFQTLVNPERSIRNSEFHGITTDMVNQPNVPRMKDLIPVLLNYVRSRQKPGGIVLLVAHNGRNFDVPFLINEFNRNSFEIPPDWHFLDTLPLAREVMKSADLKSAKISLSLQAMREYYNIAPIGTAHRAMSDVNTLSMVFQRMTFDLKLPTSGLIERSFRESDLVKPAKKTSSSSSQARPKKS